MIILIIIVVWHLTSHEDIAGEPLVVAPDLPNSLHQLLIQESNDRELVSSALGIIVSIL